MKLFGDLKRLEAIAPKVQSLMFQYGKFEEKNTVLEEAGIVKTPTYVYLKGNAMISVAGQVLDLSKMNGDIGFSTKTIEEMDNISVLGNQIITISNFFT